MDTFYVLFISIVLFTAFAKISSADDSITLSQSLTDGKFLVSKEGRFKLGFFNPGTSKRRYVGIWYNNSGVTVVWVANRCNPINGYSGVLKITNTGNLVLLSQKERVVWSPSSSRVAVMNPVLQLLDSGNLVLRDDNSEEYLWQSFDYPSNTLLPGMKLGWDSRTGLNRQLSSWKNSDDPCPGNLSFGLVHGAYPEAILREGSRKIFRSGPWDGITFSGAADLRKNWIFNFSFISNRNEVYYTYQLKNKSTLSRLFLNQSNSFQRDVWNEATKTWNNYVSVPEDECDKYSSCGPYGVCNTTASPACQCVYGFKPKLPNKWEALDWSNGCVRIKPLNFSARDGFLKFRTLKLPDTTYTWVDKSMNLNKCKAKCLSNYSCMAYTNSDISGKGSGCVMWFGELIDIRHVHEGGQDLYIRMSASVVAKHTVAKVMKLVTIVATSFVFFGSLIIFYYYIWRRKNKKVNETDHINDGHEGDLELSFFNLATIAAATDNFSINNKLGEGGFGPVYKGKLADGKEIAVKRLSRSSGQGFAEFKNEVTLISKLQHRNLVKLLGCCLEGEEKLLIYEYVPNKSLDYFIFDQARGKLLCWSKRFHIICGVARGLLYLHQDSRLRIIHRDLKASNILIDNQMNPKISDFGMAKTFGGDQTEGSTNRLVGTYGYMAPEYAIDGLFSVKSDVFSFGILLLEIVSGKRNRGFNHASLCRNLISHAWVLWKEGRPLELFDEFLLEPDAPSKALRCIQVGLLCVQQHPEHRPSMSNVVVMLTSETSLPQPKQPGFFIDNNQPDADSSSNKLQSYSINGLTITQLEGR